MDQDKLIDAFADVLGGLVADENYVEVDYHVRNKIRDLFSLLTEAPTIKIKFDKVVWPDGDPDVKYQTDGASCVDLVSAEDWILEPGNHHLFPTGLFAEIPAGFEGQVRPRSGLAFKNGLTVLNSPGTIDADYRNIIGVILVNHSDWSYPIKRGDRIAQLAICRVHHAKFEKVDQLSETERGEGGFGSTGTK